MRQQPIQSKQFSFGPGEWRLTHDPKQTYKFYCDEEDMYWGHYWGHRLDLDYDDYSRDDRMYFNLDFVGKVDKKEAEGSDSADKFSIFAKLAIMKSDGNEYISACKLFYLYSALVK